MARAAIDIFAELRSLRDELDRLIPDRAGEVQQQLQRLRDKVTFGINYLGLTGAQEAATYELRLRALHPEVIHTPLPDRPLQVIFRDIIEYIRREINPTDDAATTAAAVVDP